MTNPNVGGLGFIEGEEDNKSVGSLIFLANNQDIDYANFIGQ